MAAEVIAHDLGVALYRVDLAAAVSKDIGETEKNLDKVFAEAERTGAVLFFDEADPLFGKRSEVKDTHDRYGNAETASLLRRMEGFNGVTTLATNRKGSIDSAFLRRLCHVVDIPSQNTAGRRGG